jgi:hypothetical protein
VQCSRLFWVGEAFPNSPGFLSRFFPGFYSPRVSAPRKYTNRPPRQTYQGIRRMDDTLGRVHPVSMHNWRRCCLLYN